MFVLATMFNGRARMLNIVQKTAEQTGCAIQHYLAHACCPNEIWLHPIVTCLRSKANLKCPKTSLQMHPHQLHLQTLRWMPPLAKTNQHLHKHVLLVFLISIIHSQKRSIFPAGPDDEIETMWAKTFP